MNPRHPAVILSALAALTLPVFLGDPAVGSADRERGDLPVGTIRGHDGQVYNQAPAVVSGEKGHLYFGFELDYACSLGGKKLTESIDRMAKFATMIEKSGRTVVYTIAPGKTWGVSKHLPQASLPHGSCDSTGVRQQNAALDRPRPSYLPLRPLLVGKARQMYWKTDPHWTTVGAAAYARGLASRLDPKLGRKQHYAYTTEVRWGNLAEAIGDPVLEVGERAIPDNGVRVRTAPGGQDWSGYPTVTFDHSWTARPKQKTWPGRTVLVGDSFMWYALESLRPVFRHGRFMWLGHVPLDDVVDTIVASDTVVIEAYAAFGSLFGTAELPEGRATCHRRRGHAVIARRLSALALAPVLLFTGSAATHGAVPDHLPGPRQQTTSFMGIDGLAYTVSSSVVVGGLREKFYGPDFDLACDYGADIRDGMRSLSKLAHMIRGPGAPSCSPSPRTSRRC